MLSVQFTIIDTSFYVEFLVLGPDLVASVLTVLEVRVPRLNGSMILYYINLVLLGCCLGDTPVFDAPEYICYWCYRHSYRVARIMYPSISPINRDIFFSFWWL